MSEILFELGANLYLVLITQLSAHNELHATPEINNHEIKKEEPDPVVQITPRSDLTNNVSKCLSGVCTGLVKPHFNNNFPKSFKVAALSVSHRSPCAEDGLFHEL